MSNPIKEAILEGGRVILLAVVSYLLTEGVIAGLVGTYTPITVDAGTKIIITGIVTSVLRAVDKALHEKGKEDNNKGYLGEKGITGF